MYIYLFIYESFIEYISYVHKISVQKRLFFTGLMHWVLFWIKFLLDFYHLVTEWLLKNFFNFGPLTVTVWAIIDKQDKMQLLAEFKKILCIGVRTTLNFQNFKMALNPMHRIY